MKATSTRPGPSARMKATSKRLGVQLALCFASARAPRRQASSSLSYNHACLPKHSLGDPPLAPSPPTQHHKTALRSTVLGERNLELERRLSLAILGVVQRIPRRARARLVAKFDESNVLATGDSAHFGEVGVSVVVRGSVSIPRRAGEHARRTVGRGLPAIPWSCRPAGSARRESCSAGGTRRAFVRCDEWRRQQG